MYLKPIRSQVSAVIVSCALIGVVLFEMFWVPRLNALLIETQTSEQRKGVQILADGLLPYMLSNQIGAVHETLQSVEMRNENWVEVTLTSPGGVQLYPLGPSLGMTGSKLSTESVAIQFRDQQLGVLTVVADFSPQIQKFQAAQLQMFLIGMVIIAFLLVANIYFVDRMLVSRLLKLTKAARALARRNYDAVLPTGSDEIGLLAQSFGEMRDRIKDQTEILEDARSRAEVALEARSRFLATMSHEIRTPLNGIIPVAELLGTSDLHPSQLEKVDIIVMSGKALSSIVNDILDVTMLDGGKLTIQDGEFSPNALVAEALEVIRHNAAAKELRIVNAFNAPPDLRLRGDSNRLRQILINLLGNAVKFTEKGTITLKGSANFRDGELTPLHFEISDTGIGIPENAIGRIFNRFEQVDGSIERRFGGTGLGLSIVKDLMEAMGGRVSVQSTPGEGSTFSLDLELESFRAAGDERTRAKIVPLTEDRSRVALIVDDNGINRTVGSAILSKLGYTCEIAENGVEGVSKAQGKKFDVILMDMHMPEMGGLAATQTIRRTEGPNTDTKIIALTASVQAEDIEKCRVAGMDDFLPKPINIKNLAQLLGD